MLFPIFILKIQFFRPKRWFSFQFLVRFPLGTILPHLSTSSVPEMKLTNDGYCVNQQVITTVGPMLAIPTFHMIYYTVGYDDDTAIIIHEKGSVIVFDRQSCFARQKKMGKKSRTKIARLILSCKFVWIEILLNESDSWFHYHSSALKHCDERVKWAWIGKIFETKIGNSLGRATHEVK